MSFGFGVGDFIAVIGLANKIRKDFSAAPEQYQSIASDIKSLAIILQDVDTFLAGHDISQEQEEAMCEIGSRCKKILGDINVVLDKYSSLSTNDADTGKVKLRTKVRRAWQQVKFEPQEFRDYRHEITACITLLDTFISSVTRDNVIKLVVGQERQADQAILEWLSGSEYVAQQASNINQHLKNTGRWLLELPEYKDWIDSKGKALFLEGLPGSGKTILSSIIVEQLQQKCWNDTDIGLVYFYCDFSRQNTQTFDRIMLAWLRQLVEGLKTIPPQIKELYKQHQQGKTKPVMEETRESIHAIAKTLTKFYVVVDALDECQALDGCQKQVIQEILDLQRTVGASIIATSRPVPHILDAFNAWSSVEIRARNDDIGSYVDGNIAHLPSFVVTSPELHEEIKTSIVEGADGMFLLAKLNLESLKGKTTKKRFREALASLTKRKGDYAAAYDKTISIIQLQHPDERDLAMQVLAWVALGRRPLTVEELSHALAVESGDLDIDEDNIPELSKIISVCYGLVIVEEETNIVRMIHYTVQEFLSGSGSHWIEPFQSRLLNACIAYMSLQEFDSGACTLMHWHLNRSSKWPFYMYATRFWGNHVKSEADALTVRNFLMHDKHMEASSSALWGQMFLTDIQLTLWTPLHFIAYFGLYNSLQYVSETQDIDSTDWQNRTPLTYACEHGFEAIARALLEKGAQIDKGDNVGWTAFFYGSRNGHEAVVRALLDHGANIDGIDGMEHTALFHAARHGNEAGVHLLLKLGMQIWPTDADLHTAFTYACDGSRHDTAQILLENGANIDKIIYRKRTSLIHACIEGRWSTARFLIENGAGVNYTDDERNSALTCACANNGQDIAQSLIERGAEVNQVSIGGKTALLEACIWGNTHIARLLVEKGAKVNHNDGQWKTPLMYACEYAREEIVQLFLEKGADVNHIDGTGRSALIYACEGGREEIAHLLLEKNAEVNYVDKSGLTALDYIPRTFSYQSLVQRLLESGAQSGQDLESNAVRFTFRK